MWSWRSRPTPGWLWTCWSGVTAMASRPRSGSFTVGAEELRQPLFRWQGLVWRSMLALLDGHLEEAEEAAAEALAAGAPGETVTAPQYHLMQLLNVRREQGRSGRARGARSTRSPWPTPPGRGGAWPATTAVRDRPAPPRPRRPWTGWPTGLSGHPPGRGVDPHRGHAGPAASVLGDRRGRPGSMTCWLPYAANNIVRGVGVVCLGPVTRFLGRLAATLGRQHLAQQHFQAALEAAAAAAGAGAPAHTQLDYAEALGAGPQAAAVDRRRGCNRPGAEAARAGPPGRPALAEPALGDFTGRLSERYPAPTLGQDPCHSREAVRRAGPGQGAARPVHQE